MHPLEKSQDNTVGTHIDPDGNKKLHQFSRPGQLLSVPTPRPFTSLTRSFYLFVKLIPKHVRLHLRIIKHYSVYLQVLSSSWQKY